MDMTLENKFLKSWQVFFSNAELPLVFYHTDARIYENEYQRTVGIAG